MSTYFDYQHPGSNFLFSGGPIYNGGVNYGQGHFDGVLNTDENYWQTFLSIGKKVNNFQFSMRLIFRSPRSADLIKSEIWQIELNLCYYIFGLSDFTKKRSVYNE